MQVSGLAGLVPFISTSATWSNPVSLFTLRIGRWLLQSPWKAAASAGSVLGALIHIWWPEITDGCDISCLLIWQEIFSFHSVQNYSMSSLIQNLGQQSIPLLCRFSLCLTLCDPVDCSLPGSSVHGISQARTLEWGCHVLL